MSCLRWDSNPRLLASQACTYCIVALHVWLMFNAHIDTQISQENLLGSWQEVLHSMHPALSTGPRHLTSVSHYMERKSMYIPMYNIYIQCISYGVPALEALYALYIYMHKHWDNSTLYTCICSCIYFKLSLCHVPLSLLSFLTPSRPPLYLHLSLSLTTNIVICS